MTEGGDDVVWWVLESTALKDMLRAVHAGEDPEWVYAQAWLMAEHEDVDDAD